MRARTPDLTVRQRVDLVASLDKHGLVGGESPERLAEAMGIVIASDDLPAKLPGWAHPVGDQWYIVVGLGLSPREREWTVAHELIHIVCASPAEGQADAGAAEMLFRRREREFRAAMEAIGKTGDLAAGVGGLIMAFSELAELKPYLIDEQKKEYVDLMSVTLALVGVTGLVGFGLVKLFESLERRRRHV